MKENFIYIRTAQRDDESQSKQKKEIEKYCKENSIANYEVYVDNGYSGVILDRPSLQNMLSDIASSDCVCKKCIIYDISRLGRNLTVINQIVNTLNNYNVELISIKDGKIDKIIDTDVINI